jgi:hypothetical protein
MIDDGDFGEAVLHTYRDLDWRRRVAKRVVYQLASTMGLRVSRRGR